MLARLAWTGLLALSSAVGSSAADQPPADMPQFHDEIHVVGEVPLVEAVRHGEPVRVVFGVGELDIEAASVSEVRAEVVTRCRKLAPERCAKLRKRLRLVPRRTDQGLEVRMVGLSRGRLRKLQVEGHVVVPRWSPLSARIGIGDVDIRAGNDDLEVKMGIGDLTIHVPESQVESVGVRTRIGDAGIRASRGRGREKRLLLVGARSTWSGGLGESRIEVALKIGDATVILE